MCSLSYMKRAYCDTHIAYGFRKKQTLLIYTLLGCNMNQS
jgi:hypothetical protein